MNENLFASFITPMILGLLLLRLLSYSLAYYSQHQID